jgi:proline iminopeptidase
MTTIDRRGFLTAGSAALALGATATAAEAGRVKATGVPSTRADGVLTGGARTVRIDGRFDVWVKQVGTGHVPVLTLHGGPGFSHYYLECFEDFLPAADVRFWYYDQLGCGFSEVPDDVSLWTVERYREEVEQVRRALGLERFVLYGHSWGGMLAMEYALRYQDHLSGLVVSNMTAGVATYVEYANRLRAALPATVRERMDYYAGRGDYAAPEYQQLLFDHLYRKHLCRLDPWPEPVDRAMRSINTKIYNTMQGPDEFNIVGNYRDWDRWNDLHRITVPTLLITGRHDEMQPEQIERMGRLMPNSRVVICERGSHMAMYDDQQAYFSALVPFLHEAHGGRFSRA